MVAAVGTGLVAYYEGGFPSLLASRQGPSELSYVPADAAIVAYANVREIMDSETRQRLKAAMPPQTGQEEFQQLTGIDIERDISYVLAALTDTGQPGGLVIARGTFDAPRLEGLITSHGGQLEEYKGKRLITARNLHTDVQDHPEIQQMMPSQGPHPVGAVTLAFLEPGLIAIGAEPSIKSAIDAEMSARSITSDASMMQLVSEIDAGNNAWAVGRFDAIDQSQIPTQIRSHLPPVKTFAVMARIDGGVRGTLRADAADDQSADNLRQIVNGFLAFGRLQAENDPRAAVVMQSLQLSGSGKTVALSFTVPPALIEMLPKRMTGTPQQQK